MDSSCCLLIGGLRPMGSATSCFRLKQNDRDTPAAFERVLHVLPTGKRLQQTMGHHNFMAGKTHDFYYLKKKNFVTVITRGVIAGSLRHMKNITRGSSGYS